MTDRQSKMTSEQHCMAEQATLHGHKLVKLAEDKDGLYSIYLKSS